MISIYKRYLSNIPVTSIPIQDSIHYLNASEHKMIQKEYHSAMILSAIIGFLGVALYFIPTYLFPEFFKNSTLVIAGKTLEIPIVQILFTLFLIVIEIVALTFVQLRMTHQIGVYSGYLTPQNKEQVLDTLHKIGTDKKDQSIKKFGLDPYQGINKTALLVVNLVFKLKGFLANKLLQYIVQKISTRYAVRFSTSKYITDFIGTPIYMLLDMYSTYLIYRNAKAEIFGSLLIENFIHSLQKKCLSPLEQELIYHTLQLIAISKRDFHSNHAILTKKLIAFYEIPIKDKHYFAEEYFDQLGKTSQEIQKICKTVFIIGILLDGKVSFIEKGKIKKFNTKGALEFTFEELQVACRQFKNGQKIEILNF